MIKYKLDDIKHNNLSDQRNLMVNDAGDFIFLNDQNLARLRESELEASEITWLEHAGLLINESEDFFSTSRLFKKSLRHSPQRKLNYLIIIPTLRCNLTCSYCQVSRANEQAKGYDWTDEIKNKFIDYVEANATENVKIEFQGGEPSLRLDLVTEIVERVKAVKPNASFVICTNLSNISTDFLNLVNRDDFIISSSLDGPPEIHKSRRTLDIKNTNQFFDNLDFILSEFGSQKISLLPTIVDYSRINETIDFFYEKELPEIFLRPVNYQGFARKKFSEESQDTLSWSLTYFAALDYIANKNLQGDHQLIETGLSIHLNRIFKQRSHNYVDLRNPNLLGKDYLVVDYDGKFYPTDESRMLSRIGLIDLSIGNTFDGIDNKKLKVLNLKSSNLDDPVCNQCSYQPFCGVDNVDRISRYGTIETPTNDTYFCKNHMGIFDYIFKNLANRNEAFLNIASLCLTGTHGISSIFGGHHFD